MFNKHCQLMFNKCCQLMFNNYCQLMFHIVNLYLTTIVKLCVTIIVKFVKHNFTHRPFGVWVLLMWVVPIQDNVFLNYNPLFQGKTLWFQLCRLCTWVYLFFMFKGIYVFYLFVATPNNLFRLPTYPWRGSSHFIVLNFEILDLNSSNWFCSI